MWRDATDLQGEDTTPLKRYHKNTIYIRRAFVFERNRASLKAGRVVIIDTDFGLSPV